MGSSSRRLQLIPLCLVLLAVFGLYVGAVRLMPFHDDAVLMPAINNRTLLTIFENRPYGDGHHRPMSYIPWLLTRDLFGWFIAPVLHMWNVWAHVLNTALVAAIAARLGSAFGLRSPAWPVSAAVLFGLAPLSYEAVLWASALVHPLMATFGLGALNAYLAAQRSRHARGWLLALTAILLLAACLSHEMGFVFGALIAVCALALAWRDRRRPDPAAFILLGGTLAYALIYRFVLVTKWTDPASRDYARNPGEIVANLAYQAQYFVAWILVFVQTALRALGLAPIGDQLALLFALFALAVLIACAAVWLAAARRRKMALLTLAALALALWLVAIAPSALLLTQDYVWSSPRMTYVPSIGVALFWGLVAAIALGRWQRRTSAFSAFVRALAVAALVVVVAGWSAAFIAARLNESARLTPALAQIDAELRASDPSARLLLINSSFSNFANPTFFPIGREGMPIWEYGYKVADGPMWAWPAAVSGTVRETANVRHLASLGDHNPDTSSGYYFTTGAPFYYGVFGDEVDDGALRAAILQSDMVFRFAYDPPGLRAVRLARRGERPEGGVLAELALGGARATVVDAAAFACGRHDYLDLTWSNVAGLGAPAGVFVHGYDAAGQRVSVADLDPVGGLVPLDQFPAGATITERREIERAAPARAVAYRVGVYERASGQRYAAQRADGTTWEGDEIVIPVRDAAVQSFACP